VAAHHLISEISGAPDSGAELNSARVGGYASGIGLLSVARALSGIANAQGSADRGGVVAQGSRTPQTALICLGRAAITQGSPLDGQLTWLADLVKKSVTGADEVSIILTDRFSTQLVAATGQIARELHQPRSGAGPSQDAAASGRIFEIPDTAAAVSPYPQLASQAAARGIGSIVAVGLPLVYDTGGALTLYSRRSGAFDSEAVSSAQQFANLLACLLARAAVDHARAAVRYGFAFASE
jgi:GAF domain